MKKFLLFFLLTNFNLLYCQLDKRFVLYLLHKNEIERSINYYQDFHKETKEQDFSLLAQVGQILLEKGSKSNDKETQLLSMFGAGLSAHTKAIDILETGLSCDDPQIQMVALHFIAKLNDVKTDILFTQAMRSVFLSTRMEAAYYMAEKKHSHSAGQMEALMYRLPPVFKQFFPQLFALNGSKEAISMLQKLLNDPQVYVRIEAILSIMNQQRDDLLPSIRNRATTTNIAEQEACAFALGGLNDSSSISVLNKLALSSTPEVQLAALKSLYRLGVISAGKQIETLAKNRHLFAIAALGEVNGSEEGLIELCKNRDIQVRINAICSLLKRKDPRVIAFIEEILIQDVRDLAFQPITSIGRSHQALKAIPSAWEKTEQRNIDLNHSFAIKEALLQSALNLSEKSFLAIVRKVLDCNQNSLVPQAITLVEKLGTKEAISLLKEYCQRAGSPLIRSYCNLALFRLKEEGPFQEMVLRWVMSNYALEIIQLKPLLPWKDRLIKDSYCLTEKESSQLLIDSFTALAAQKDDKSISLLLNAIKSGNPKNRYVLAGLLIRAVE